MVTSKTKHQKINPIHIQFTLVKTAGKLLDGLCAIFKVKKDIAPQQNTHTFI